MSARPPTAPKERQAPRRALRPGQGKCLFLISLYFLVFSFFLSLPSFCQLEAEGSVSGAGALESREEGGAVDPWVGKA